MESADNPADKMQYSSRADKNVDDVIALSQKSLRCITSEQLFAGATEVQISHRGALYRLKQTSLGKLILTK